VVTSCGLYAAHELANIRSSHLTTLDATCTSPWYESLAPHKTTNTNAGIIAVCAEPGSDDHFKCTVPIMISTGQHGSNMVPMQRFIVMFIVCDASFLKFGFTDTTFISGHVTSCQCISVLVQCMGHCLHNN